MNSREIFSKTKFNNNQLTNVLSNTLEVVKDDILIVEESEDWLKRNGKPIVVEYKAFLDDKEEDDEYYGYHYYDLYLDDDRVLNKLKDLQKELGNDVIIALE
ncbi:hypothetical protein NBE98_09685 [Clostridium swellfunianum]|uniref:hypothetical protein n=1 Tax=Clostridium swellfunianum TaxID=1367462 RepID=UPI00202E056E|nr:hypothetical protein [Clostridium swellfunianum]MCM0648644.1 hypothetical protein [Clostridium swellfunianum]